MEKVIIFLGLPGAGKGTQAKLLKKKFGFNLMGSGDLLRERKKEDDFTGSKIAQVIDKGGRVPAPVIAKIWLDKFENFKKKGIKGLIVDGSPRSILEKEIMEKALGWYEWSKKTTILLIDISEEESIKRLTHRRNCKDCKSPIPFVGEFKEMKKCPYCGGELVGRKDDTEEGVKTRLKWFKTDVQPVIDSYQEEDKMVRVNGEQSIEGVFKEILGVI